MQERWGGGRKETLTHRPFSAERQTNTLLYVINVVATLRTAREFTSVDFHANFFTIFKINEFSSAGVKHGNNCT